MQKNKSSQTPIIIVLITILLIMSGYIIYDKVFTSKETDTAKEEIDYDKVYNNYQKEMQKNLPQLTDIAFKTSDIEYKAGIRELIVNKENEAVIEFDEESTLYKKYGQNYKIAKDVLYSTSLLIGNGFQKVIFFLKIDGSISYIYIKDEKIEELKMTNNLLNIKNVTSIFNYTKYIENAPSTVGIYALDIEGKIHNLDSSILKNN